VPMGEREALLRAVCDNPDDDLPRLVFADWLEEHGEPERAEFIRVQIRLSRLTFVPLDEPALAKSLRERQRLLWAANHRIWLDDLPKGEGTILWPHDWSRGFPRSLTRSSLTKAPVYSTAILTAQES